MLDYRRMLMEDFSLSPEIVLHCRAEIEAHCSGLHRKGRTLHCLMRIGRGDRSTTVDSSCQSAVRIPHTAEIITSVIIVPEILQKLHLKLFQLFLPHVCVEQRFSVDTVAKFDLQLQLAQILII